MLCLSVVLIAELYAIVWIFHILDIPYFVCHFISLWTLGLFLILVVVNNTANTCVQDFGWTFVLFLLIRNYEVK